MTTTQAGGETNTKSADISNLVTSLGKLQDALDYFLAQKPLSQYQDYSHCKSVKLFLRDEILMKQAADALEKTQRFNCWNRRYIGKRPEASM